MERLKEYIKRVYEKIKALSMKWKIIIGTGIAVFLVLIIILSTYGARTKYAVLFSGLSADDNKTITDTLTTDKISYQVRGEAIYVPEGERDRLRLELASSLKGGSVGYEFFDTSSIAGQTDAQFAIEKQRAQQGELQRTIMSFPQVENARVSIAMPEESAFVTDSNPGKVAVYLTLKNGMKLENSQVKAIIALISDSLDNVPKENVSIVDDKLNLLSANANKPDSSSVSVTNQQLMENKVEDKLRDAIMDVLGPSLGENKVKVQVNVNMDFSSKETTKITYDPNKVLLSRHFIAKGSLGELQANNLSPVDNNMTSYSITTGAAVTKQGVTDIDSTENYNNGSTTEKVLNVPGVITRVTASVLYDKSLGLTAAQENTVKQFVQGAIGYDQTRNDQVSVGGIAFDQSANQAAAAEIAALKAETAMAQKDFQFKVILACSIFGLIIVGALMYFGIKKLSKSMQVKKARKADSMLDVTVGEEPLFEQEVIPHIPLDLDVENETDLIEKDIKKYAEEKPDQVADIIKSWLAEDER